MANKKQSMMMGDDPYGDKENNDQGGGTDPYGGIDNPYPGGETNPNDPYQKPWNDWYKGAPILDSNGNPVGGGDGEGEGNGGFDFGGYSAPPFPQYQEYGPVPVFTAPQFTYDQKFYAPDFNEMQNDPGYKFRASEGQRAVEQSAAGRGALNSGGTLKDLDAWTQNFASQEYGNVYNRALGTYATNYGVARDEFDRLYAGAKDMYAPKFAEWQAKNHWIDTNYAALLQKWFHDTLSASDILQYGG